MPPRSSPPADGTPGAIVVREAGLAQPLDWLRRGLEDLLRCPGPGLAHGAVSALFGVGIVWLAHDHFWILAGAFSGFLIVAPIVATGLYAISRSLERGEPTAPAAAWRLMWRVWRGHDPRLVHFGVLLAFAGTGWVLTSASLVTSFAAHPVHRPLDFLHHVVLHDASWLFEVWLMLGALLAAPVFASSVVAIPLLLDRPRVSVLRAVLTSWRAVMASPATLAFWAGILMVVTLVGMATLLVGLVIVVPWLAHASWHAYRDLVVPESDSTGAAAPHLPGRPQTPHVDPSEPSEPR
ncbi:MAG: DUF2189 domain-containing protein [Burkholderiales bacterium]|nr:DUF2189 domain-containing protein [Burkholderiales bacterium]